jgi:hypothetical protein
MNRRTLAACICAFLAADLNRSVIAEEVHMPLVRIAQLEIDPERLESYTAAVKEEIETSIRVEPGVLAIYAVAEKDNPSKLRFFVTAQVVPARNLLTRDSAYESTYP